MDWNMQVKFVEFLFMTLWFGESNIPVLRSL